jgi:hypothetical protein
MSVTMYGPAFSEGGNFVQREVPDADVVAFEKAGYVKGVLPPNLVPAKALKGKLPEDFPGLSALEAEGLTTYAKVRKRLDDLTTVSGIGEATAEKIRAAMNESSEAEEEQE